MEGVIEGLKNANKEANKANDLNINDHLLSLVKAKNKVTTKWVKLKPKVNPETFFGFHIEILF